MLPAADFTDVYTDFSGFARMRAQARDDSPQALQVAARQFESLFVQMMLKSMRQASFGDPLFDSTSSRFYREMFDQQLSVDLAKTSGLGIADMLVRQLGGGAGAGTAPASPAAPVEPANAAVPSSRTTSAGEEFPDKQSFIDTLRPYAEQAAADLGTDPNLLLAQAALESGWGRAVMQYPDGTSSHNLFGIKAASGWTGPRVVKDTLEYEEGLAVRRREPFRAYGSYAQSFADYAAFLRGAPRYQAALDNAADPEAFIRSVQQAGYASDPDYADKVLRLWREDLPGGVKLAEALPLQATR